MGEFELMEKITVYTAITGGYDTLQQPFMPAESFEFICFVEKGAKRQEREGVWKIEEIPFDWDDSRLLARYTKLNPQSVLPEDTQWSLWIDANIRITNGKLYEICRHIQAEGVVYAGVRHPFRDCVYEELEHCLKDRRESFGKIMSLARFLRRQGVPEHAGLMETNLIFRKHNDPSVVEFDRWWWKCLLKHSHRDQLTHTFCLLDTPIRYGYLFPEGVSTRNFSGLEYVKHPSQPLNWLHRKIKYGMNKPELFILHIYLKLSRPR